MKRGRAEMGGGATSPVEVTGPVAGVGLYNVRLWAALPSAMPSNSDPWTPPNVVFESAVTFPVWVDATPPPEMCLLDTTKFDDEGRMKAMLKTIIDASYEDVPLDLCVCSADGERAFVFALALLMNRVRGYVPSSSVAPEASDGLKCDTKLSTGALELLQSLDKVYLFDYSE